MARDRLEELAITAQRNVFRLAERDHGLTLKAISIGSNIPYTTIRSYAGSGCETVMMPVSALLKLVGTVPDYLLSLPFWPVSRRISVREEGEGDLDDLGCEAAGFTHEYVDATRDGVVTPIERARLRDGAIRLGGIAAKVSA